MKRCMKTYSYAVEDRTDIVYIKIFTATFRVKNGAIHVYQEDDWTIQECADAMTFKKVVEGGDLYVLPDEIIREVGKFLLGGRGRDW